MGALPDLLPGYQRVADADVRHRVAAVWGVEPPTYPGLRIPDMFDAAIDGQVRALYVMGEDIAQTDPDSARAGRVGRLRPGRGAGDLPEQDSPAGRCGTAGRLLPGKGRHVRQL